MPVRNALVDEAIKNLNMARNAARVAAENLEEHPRLAAEAEKLAGEISHLSKRLWSV